MKFTKKNSEKISQKLGEDMCNKKKYQYSIKNSSKKQKNGHDIKKCFTEQ